MAIKKIVIVGGGATGWTVASLLAKQLPRELVKIQVVDDSRQDTECVEFTRSAIHRFHELIGLHEKKCLLNSNASFGLGLKCQDTEKDYLLVEGAYGAPLDTIDFQSLYYKSVLLGSSHKLEDYSLNAVAARSGRFGHPVADPKSIYSSIQYGLHLELGSYADILRSHALALGVEAIKSDCQRVNLNVNTGAVESIELNNGQVVAGDFFIDCSGDQSVLLGDAMGVTSVSNHLDKIFDSMAVGYRPLTADAKPVTQLINTDIGYLKIIPLKHQEYVRYVYASRFIDDEAIKQKMQSLNVSDVVFSPLNCNKKEQFWVKNCVAIGHASVSIYELFISPLSLVRNAVVRLLDLLADFNDLSGSAIEYNRLTQLELECLNELTEIYFYVNRSSNSALNEYFKQHDFSISAKHRFELFAYCGRHPQQSTNIFSEREWAAFWAGNQVLPKVCNLDVDSYDQEKLIEYTEKLRTVIYKAAEKMPMHADYIARIA